MGSSQSPHVEVLEQLYWMLYVYHDVGNSQRSKKSTTKIFYTAQFKQIVVDKI